MHARFITGAAVAALLAMATLACAQAEPAPQAEESPHRMPAWVGCRDGQVVTITTITLQPGPMTIVLPPKVCDGAQPKEAAPKRRAPAPRLPERAT